MYSSNVKNWHITVFLEPIFVIIFTSPFSGRHRVLVFSGRFPYESRVWAAPCAGRAADRPRPPPSCCWFVFGPWRGDPLSLARQSHTPQSDPPAARADTLAAALEWNLCCTSTLAAAEDMHNGHGARSQHRPDQDRRARTHTHTHREATYLAHCDDNKLFDDVISPCLEMHNGRQRRKWRVACQRTNLVSKLKSSSLNQSESSSVVRVRQFNYVIL